MLNERKPLYEELETSRGTKVITYVTGDRPGWETQISPEVVDLFVHHLDIIGPTPKITLFLYTRGGAVLSAWSIANLLRQFCDELEVVLPSKAQSSGTLMALAADRIIMTKQATLGPIDPSVNGPLNPLVPGAGPNARVPVSVEAINGFVEFVKSAIGEDTTTEHGVANALAQLATQVHPLVLGDAYRSRAQIRMLAKRLVARQLTDAERVTKVLDFLCSGSGSHDYTIYRREARDDLGLKVETPTPEGYALIKRTYDDIATELQLAIPFDPIVMLAGRPEAPYVFRRGLVESRAGGCHVFLSEGVMRTHQQQMIAPGLLAGLQVQDQRTFEGWRHEP